MAAHGACRRTSRRRKAYTAISLVLLALVDQVLGRILRSEGAASFCSRLVGRGQATMMVGSIPKPLAIPLHSRVMKNFNDSAANVAATMMAATAERPTT